MSGPGVEELVDDRGLHWRIDPAYADAVRRSLLPHFDELSRRPGVDVVKRNNVRTVMRFALDVDGMLQQVYLKRYHAPGSFEAIKRTLFGSRARHEWEMATALEAAGIRTAHPIAWAEKRRFGVVVDAAYLCVGLVDAIDFCPYVESRAPEPERDTADALRRRTLLGELARRVRRMHDRGLDHGDLHGGNVLVVPDATHRDVELHLIDLHRASRRAGPVPLRTRVARVAQLLHSIRSVADASARYRFVRDYAAGLDGIGEIKHLVHEIERRIIARERRRLLSRSKRSLTRSSRFDLDRKDGFSVWFRRTHPAARLVDAVRDLDRAGPRPDDPAVFKRGPRAIVTRGRVRGPWGEESVVIKEYRPRRLRHALASMLGRSRGRAAWFNGNALVVRKVRVARPYGWLVARRGPFVRRDLVVMEDVSVHGERLDHHLLRRFRAGELGRTERRALIDLGARFVAGLHRAGIYHGDLKACNLYVGEDDEGRRELRLVDYDDVRFGWTVSERRRVKNLAQLSASIPRCVSRSDRLRFFLACAPADAPRWREIARAVDRECASKIVVDMDPIE